MCRVCAELPEVERRCVGRPLCVHHRQPGISKLPLLITLCLAHHAMVTRTQLLVMEWPELLRVLWREQHPEAAEQLTLSFAAEEPAAERVPLFVHDDRRR